MQSQNRIRPLRPLAARTTSLAAIVVLLFASLTHADEKIYLSALRATGLVTVKKGEGWCSSTGTLVDVEHRLMLTNYHVVSGGETFLTQFAVMKDGRPVQDPQYYQKHVPAIRARVIASDSMRDLALIQLESLPEGAAALPLAGHSPLPGSSIYLVGNGQAVKACFGFVQGTVRGVARQSYTLEGGQKLDAVMVMTQMPINPGDSGAAIVNAKSEIVAVNHSYTREGRTVSMSTDVSEIRAFLRSTGPMVQPRQPFAQRNENPAPPEQRDTRVADPLIPNELLVHVQRQLATANVRHAVILAGVTHSSMTIRGKTISDYFSRSEPQVRQVISNMLLAPNARERVVWMKRLQRDQASLAHEMQQFIARIGTTRSAGLSDAERRMIVHKFESLSARAMEMGDAMHVAMKMP